MAGQSEGPEPAVAASMAGQSEGPEPAVAASPEDLARVRVTQPFMLNNVALKWIRDSHENPPGSPTTDCVDLTLTDPLQIGVIDRNSGMDYKFKAGETKPWSWRQMLAALNPTAKDFILGSNPALGVVRITCAPVHGSYDHKRWHAARHLGRPYAEDAAVPVWDFFITRTDGTTVRFHTSYTNNKVEMAKVSKDQTAHELPKPPKKGKGKSDGRGTYRRKTQGNYDQVAPSRQNNRGGGDESAVAEPRRGGDALPRNNPLAAPPEAAPPEMAPPGLDNSEPRERDGWRRGWTENRGWTEDRGWTRDSWNGWQDWSSGWQDRGSGWRSDWQGRGYSSNDASWRWQND
jgi:hypothetical protein